MLYFQCPGFCQCILLVIHFERIFKIFKKNYLSVTATSIIRLWKAKLGLLSDFYVGIDPKDGKIFLQENPISPSTQKLLLNSYLGRKTQSSCTFLSMRTFYKNCTKLSAQAFREFLWFFMKKMNYVISIIFEQNN